jgi:hypothetical protein
MREYAAGRFNAAGAAETLQGYKTDDKSTTTRVVATCCNSAMVMRFDDAKHWVRVYRARFRCCSADKDANDQRLLWRVCADMPKKTTLFQRTCLYLGD